MQTQTDRRGDVCLWDRWEESFTVREPVANEVDLRFTVEMTAPSGSTRVVPGFWDGGSVWTVRFMPDEVGTWQYRTQTEPVVAGLHGKDGQFTVRAAEDPSNRFLRHGPVRVAENGRYLEHEDETPFFWLMDTAWNGALKSTSAGWETYLDDRLSKGFTGIQFVTTQWRGAHSDRECQTAYSGYRDIAIHPAFFQRLDRRIDAINEVGLMAAPVVLWALGDRGTVPGTLPEDQAIRLARYITARYGAHHVVWLLAGDADVSGRRGKRWRRIGRAVFEEPSHTALATVHPRGRQWEAEKFRGEDWYDLILYQSSHGGGTKTLEWIHSGPPAQHWGNDPPLPVINAEPGYEDLIAWERLFSWEWLISGERTVRHTAFDVRRQAYYSLLSSPPAGVSYGAHGVWSWETEPSRPMNHWGTGLAKPWGRAIRFPGSDALKHLAGLFTSADWHTLRPAQDILVDQPGEAEPTKYVAAARSTEGPLAIVYIPEGGSIRVNAERLSSTPEARWFNPRDGSRREAVIAGGSTYTAPDGMDWVLILE